jgi:hypothetical protein
MLVSLSFCIQISVLTYSFLPNSYAVSSSIDLTSLLRLRCTVYKAASINYRTALWANHPHYIIPNSMFDLDVSNMVLLHSEGERATRHSCRISMFARLLPGWPISTQHHSDVRKINKLNPSERMISLLDGEPRPLSPKDSGARKAGFRSTRAPHSTG